MLNKVHCKSCGTNFWSDAASGDIHAGPCCFGKRVVLVGKHKTRDDAEKVWPAYLAYRELDMAKMRGIIDS